ncbi:hypothetical protein H0H92_009829, partial [Tricholoma furcatifolium]
MQEDEGDLDIIDDQDDSLTNVDEDALVQTLQELRSIRALDEKSDDEDDQWTAFVGRATARAHEDGNTQSRSVQDEDEEAPPRLWRIPVKRGREEAIASFLARKALPSKKASPSN